jgi:hypothetical protein
VRPSGEFREHLAKDLERLGAQVASGMHLPGELIASAVGGLAEQPKRFTRAWLVRYRWAAALTGSAAVAAIGLVAYFWRSRQRPASRLSH